MVSTVCDSMFFFKIAVTSFILDLCLLRCQIQNFLQYSARIYYMIELVDGSCKVLNVSRMRKP